MAQADSRAPGANSAGHALDAQGSVFELQVRVYYQDTDAGGIVYHTRYLDFMERARTEWLRALGIDLSRMAGEHGRMFVAKSLTIDYLRPARLDDMLTVRTYPKRVGHAFMDLNQAIFHGSMQLTGGEVRIVCVNAQSLRPSALPRELATRIHRTGPPA